MKNFLRYVLVLCVMGQVACTGCGEEVPAPEVINTLTSFSFKKADNEGAILDDIIQPQMGDHSVTFISPLYLDSSNLVATFATDGGKVYVGDVEQVSGQTPNDFSTPVIYRIISETGHISEWEVTLSNTGLPIVVINTPNRKMIPSKHEDWMENTQLTIYNPDLTIDYQESISIRGRGNSTWNFPKKPYALKLDEKASILGMPKHKRWVLLANWLDRTMMRNSAAFYISEQTDLAWTPRGEFVEVVLNGRHKGNYYLCEQIKVDKNRVDIEELSDENPSGGFILEVDVYFDEAFKFHSPDYNLPYMFKDPDEVTDMQYGYFYNYIANLEAALKDDQRFAAREYVDFIDIDSFIDWWFVHELTGNTEPMHPKSSYLHKDADGPLVAGPVWDFDWETFVPYKNNVWCDTEALYLGRLFQDEAFVARVKERWALLKPRFDTVPSYIQSLAKRLTPSAAINLKMWPITEKVNGDEELSFALAVTRMINAYEGKLYWLNKHIEEL